MIEVGGVKVQVVLRRVQYRKVLEIRRRGMFQQRTKHTVTGDPQRKVGWRRPNRMKRVGELCFKTRLEGERWDVKESK